MIRKTFLIFSVGLSLCAAIEPESRAQVDPDIAMVRPVCVFSSHPRYTIDFNGNAPDLCLHANGSPPGVPPVCPPDRVLSIQPGQDWCVKQ